MANRSILTGRLTADPELRQTPNSIPVTSFSIAVPRKYKKDVVDYIDIVAWRKNAEFVCNYFSKGKWIEIDGSIQTRTYKDKEGNNRKAFEVLADEVNFVGNKPKDEAAPGAGVPVAPPPPPPKDVDPFAAAAAPAPPHDSFSHDHCENDDDDLPF